MEKLTLAGMRFFAHHGVLIEERTHGQEFVIDVELEGDLAAAARRDDLALTIDYRLAYDAVRTVMEGESRQLIETLAEDIAGRLLALDRVRAATVRVRKPQVKLPGPLESSGVEVRRTRE